MSVHCRSYNPSPPKTRASHRSCASPSCGNAATAADSAAVAIAVAEILAEDALPSLEPLLLLRGGQAAWRAEGPGQDFAQTGT